MGHKRPPVAFLTIQLDPAPQYLVKIRVGLVVGVGQGSLIVSHLLLEGGAGHELAVKKRLEDELGDRCDLPCKDGIPILQEFRQLVTLEGGAQDVLNVEHLTDLLVQLVRLVDHGSGSVGP
jgi:hypothetical protein